MEVGNLIIDNAVLGFGMRDTNPQNLLINGSFEYWNNGTSDVAPDGWEDRGANVTYSQVSGRKGGYALRMVGNGSVVFLTYQALPNYEDYRGLWMTVSGWIKTTDSAVSLRLQDGASTGGEVVSVGVPTTGEWEFVWVSKMIRQTNDKVQVIVWQSTGEQGGTVDVDELSLVIGRAPFSYVPNQLDYLLKPSRTVITPADVIAWGKLNGYNGICDLTGSNMGMYPINDSGHFIFPLNQIPGKYSSGIDDYPVVIDSILVYYWNSSTSSYIANTAVMQNNLDGTYTAALDYTTDYGKTVSGDQNQEIVSTPFQHPGKPLLMDFNTVGTSGTIKVRMVNVLWHVKVG